MNYLKHYYRLIEKAQVRVIEDKSIYTEKHHIVPRSEGGTDDPSNLVHLYPREHFLAHWLLYRDNPTQSRGFAFNMMASTRLGIYKISSRTYAEAKEAAALSQSIRNTGIKSVVDPLTRIEKRVKPEELDFWLERGWVQGRHLLKRNVGRFWSNNGEREAFRTFLEQGWNRGRLKGSNTLGKVAVSKDGRTRYVDPSTVVDLEIQGWKAGVESHNRPWEKYQHVKLECPHCGKIGGYQGMKRNHFENCKHIH